MEDKRDREDYIRWKNFAEGKMLTKNLIRLAIDGHQQCEEYCISRDSKKYGVGKDGCACIRETFPTPDHYKVYREMRRVYQEKESLLQLNEIIYGNCFPKEKEEKDGEKNYYFV